MRAATTWIALGLVFAVACSKVKKKFKPPEPNRIEILTWTSAGPGSTPEKFEGTFTAKTSVITWLGDDLFLVVHELVMTETADKVDINVRVRGGGTTGQAGALRHGIARALVEYNADLRGKLKAAGFLTRDPREVERKKYGHKGARKSFQFSKR